MEWRVEYTDKFGAWWDTLTEGERETLDACVGLLINYGPALAYPYSSSIRGSRHRQMRELRIQHQGKPYRVFYAFDPRRTAILLIGGTKGSDKQWYKRFVPIADALYDDHLKILRRKGFL